MSLSKSSLSAIQQAGHTLHQATVVVAAAVREQAQHLVSTVASQPFEAEGEQAFNNFKLLARLSQDLQSLEDQLRKLYATAAELARPEMDVVAALPLAGDRKRSAAGPDAVEDAVVKPTSARKAARTPANKRRQGRKTASLTPNDKALLQYLQTALQRDSGTRMTGSAMAQGAGLPLGSVGISLKRLADQGRIKKSGAGSYKLG